MFESNENDMHPKVYLIRARMEIARATQSMRGGLSESKEVLAKTAERQLAFEAMQRICDEIWAIEVQLWGKVIESPPTAENSAGEVVLGDGAVVFDD